MTSHPPSSPETTQPLLTPDIVLQEARDLHRYWMKENKPYSAGVVADCIATIENLLSRPVGVAQAPSALAARLDGHASNCEVDGMHQAALDLREAAKVLRSADADDEKIRTEISRYIADGAARDISPYDTAVSILLYLANAQLFDNTTAPVDVEELAKCLYEAEYCGETNPWHRQQLGEQLAYREQAKKVLRDYAVTRPHRRTGEA